MSSDPPNGVRSPTPEPGEPGRAAVVATLGAALIDALELHLPGARRHAESTAAFAFATAVELGGERERSELVREAARLHDVGMVYVPAEILRKPSAELDDAERALLASHIEAGARLAAGAGIPEDVCAWILHTREQWAGGGPSDLRFEQIPLPARVIRVACAADLLLATANRAETVAALRAAADTELDSTVVEALARVLERTV